MNPTGSSGKRAISDCLAQVARGIAATRSMRMEPSDRPVELTRALIDAASLFDELSVSYALIGGLAAMIHGRARFTEDIDFVAAPGHEAILAANPALMRTHHFDPGCTWKLYHTNGIEIDLWKDEHAPQIISRAISVTLDGRAIRVAEANDLVAMKLRAGRMQDDYDISEMIRSGAARDEIISQRVTAEQFAHYRVIQARVAGR